MFLHDYSKDCNRLFGLTPNCALCNKSPPGATRAMGTGDTHGKADAM